MTLQRRLAILTAFGLVIGAALAMLWSSSRAVVEAQQGQAGQGQTATRLADGRWLLVGGDGRSDVAALWDPGTGRPTTLAPGSLLPRSGHTATLLPDGSVLIVGGRDVNGRLIPGGDLFDPQTATFTPLPVEGGLPRTSHTATLMTDGRVLIAGGTTDQGTATADLEIWDVQPQNITNVTNPAGQLKWGRSAHTATLVGDGRVLLSGGTSADGRRVRQVEIYDPADQQVREATVAATDRTPVRVTASIPADGAHDIPIDVRPVLRFSSALRPETINGGTVSLRGPEGPVEIALVPAEGGRLVFVSPRLPLSRDTSYVLTIADAAGTGGLGVVAAQVSFVTAADNVDTAGQIDEEAWAPDAESLKKGWRSNRPDSPWEKLPPLEARPGVTALAGQVLRLDGRPLADVTLAMDGHSTRSDRTGRFLLRLDSLVSGEHELLIDARTANRPRRTYGVFEARVTITTGRTTTLPFTIWSPVLDTLHQVTIPSPTKTETVITTPLIPGLELHLPAGTVIRDHDGAVVRTIGITPIPVDRPPFPMPADAEFPVFFTIQPGGAYLHSYGASKGGWLVYPNVGGSPNGKRVQFFHYDPEDKGWYVYGMGTVTGTKVVPDAKTRIYGFTGASFNDGNTPPAEGPPPGDPAKDGDPVSLSTGIFVYEKTDLALPDVLPIGITRTYNSKDSQPRPFGRGMTHGFAIFQHSELQWEEADLILPDGGKVHYVRISAAGLPWNQTVFEHTATPTAFYKSRIAWNGANGWDLTLRDGTVYVFGHAAPLQAIRDRYGNQITVSWSAVNAFGAGTGNITRLTSPNGRWIAFTYDASNRVTQATDNLGRTVGYQYDASGRLWKVTDAAGGVTEHTYDASHRMLTIKDPRGIVYLTNEYDANGRVSRQTQADSTTYEFAYTLDGGGKVTQTDVTNPRGFITRTAFNASGYTTSVVEGVGTAQQRATSITRQGGTQFVERVTDGLSRHTDFTYDAKGNVTGVTQLAGTQDAVTTSYAYESTFSQLTSITDPLSHTTTLTRDVMGNVTTITDPLGHQTTFTYNTAGQPLTATTPAGRRRWATTWGMSSRSRTRWVAPRRGSSMRRDASWP
jgi:YD repeat-containing protein